MVAVLAAALGLAGLFGVVHSVVAAEDVGAAVWAATCVLWAGFLAVMARQLGWEDPNSSSSSSAHRRRRCVRAAAAAAAALESLFLTPTMLSCARLPGAERVEPHRVHNGDAASCDLYSIDNVKRELYIALNSRACNTALHARVFQLLTSCGERFHYSLVRLPEPTALPYVMHQDADLTQEEQWQTELNPQLARSRTAALPCPCLCPALPPVSLRTSRR